MSVGLEDFTPPPELASAEAYAAHVGKAPETPAVPAPTRARDESGRFVPAPAEDADVVDPNAQALPTEAAALPPPIAEPAVVEAPKVAPVAPELMAFMQQLAQQQQQDRQLLLQVLQQSRQPAAPPKPAEPEVRFEDLEPLDQIGYLAQQQRQLAQENAQLRQQLGQTTAQQQAYETQRATASVDRDLAVVAQRFPELDPEDQRTVLTLYVQPQESRSIVQIAEAIAHSRTAFAQKWAAKQGLSVKAAPVAAVRTAPPTPQAENPSPLDGLKFNGTEEDFVNGFSQIRKRYGV